ncbi:MAG: ABC transporter ATP-binding protein [Paracoccaceae bacterium]|nr:ABC transporter ATP-binding protein [Paracoccaceae bacterium]
MDNNQLVAIEFQKVVKKFGSFTAIHKANLKIHDNEFFTLLGPSGCGKTTLLRMVAGFENVTEGNIFLFGKEFMHLPPNKRSVNTVFQQYALFPHMTVFENVAFGLKMRGWAKDDIQPTVWKMLDLVRLRPFAERKPNQLSGGQQQRAALVRAIAPQPKVLLLDEPLSALDLKLRQAMRLELKQLQQETGITFVFVTHDQEEALAMSDRIAVMSEGVIQQIGKAQEIYESPKNEIVANFIGETNILQATLLELNDEEAKYQIAEDFIITGDCVSGLVKNQEVKILLRPEKIRIGTSDNQVDSIQGTIQQSMYLGTDTEYQIRVPGEKALKVRDQNGFERRELLPAGSEVSLSFSKDSIRILRS